MSQSVRFQFRVSVFCAALFLAAATAPQTRGSAVDNVSLLQMDQMQLLYAVDDGAFDFEDAYTVDNSGSITAGSFERVAYYVE
ncbi:MAG: hypothetical protein KDA42_07150, partial [Planctomycetales bacterium]|nr:hypothetical protein [Planctomycetales bacterium]